MANAPGVNVTVNTPASSPITNNPTGTWYVTGITAGGPSGVAVPVNSIQDLNTYFGTYVNSAVTSRTSASAVLYDSLDVYFREGGIRAFVSSVVATGGTAATATITGSGSGTWLTLTATGKGTWANSANTSPAGLIVTIAAAGTNGYSLTVAYNGNQIGQTSPPLFTATDAVNWINSLAVPGVLFTAVAGSGTGVPNPASVYFTSGADGSVAESDWTTALNAFLAAYGPGQVSAPGHTTTAGWQALANHALANNRVAILDAVDGASAATLTGAAGSAAIQVGGSAAATDSSYAAMFAPWVKVPGIASTQPNVTSPTFSRIVPPSAMVCSNIAASDAINDANVPAAGVQNGSSAYATDVTTTYSASDRATCNNAGVNLIRNINGTVAVYGFRSLSTDTNWIMLNNVRFRMQIVRDLDVISEPFVFAEIDGKGQIFARLAGALSGQCQNYWLRNSIYGINPEDSFTVNCGPQVNTPATIASGVLNAQINLRMSPQAEQVSITVTKYLSSASLPSY